MSAPHPHDKVVAIVQARLGSSRLPLKSLLCLRDVPLIDWVVRRLKTAARLDGLVVAVPDTPLDRVLLEHLQRRGVPLPGRAGTRMCWPLLPGRPSGGRRADGARLCG